MGVARFTPLCQQYLQLPLSISLDSWHPSSPNQHSCSLSPLTSSTSSLVVLASSCPSLQTPTLFSKHAIIPPQHMPVPISHSIRLCHLNHSSLNPNTPIILSSEEWLLLIKLYWNQDFLPLEEWQLVTQVTLKLRFFSLELILPVYTDLWAATSPLSFLRLAGSLAIIDLDNCLLLSYFQFCSWSLDWYLSKEQGQWKHKQNTLVTASGKLICLQYSPQIKSVNLEFFKSNWGSEQSDQKLDRRL